MQTKLEKEAQQLLESAINEVFTTLHNKFKTQSGDILPDQVTMLDYYTNQLSKLIAEQVKQNL
jgi:uncharacterized lipoprotein YmbA